MHDPHTQHMYTHARAMASETRRGWPIRLLDTEKELIRRAAAAEDDRPSSWARRTLLRVARETLKAHCKLAGDRDDDR